MIEESLQHSLSLTPFTMDDAIKTKNMIIEWIREFFNQSGNNCNAVIGISGGKDSSVVAALCVEALGKDRVIGVKMPCGTMDNEAADKLIKFLDIKSYTVNIEGAVRSILDSIPFEASEQTKINLPARIRMSTLYAVSQSNNGRVSNNCNLSEDWVGYSTRYGDSVGDFSPLSHLTVTEVKWIGKALNLPQDLIEKVPTDGLCGKTDEENLGFSYDVLDYYIRTGRCDNLDAKIKIDYLHRKNEFKLHMMPSFQDIWWILSKLAY